MLRTLLAATFCALAALTLNPVVFALEQTQVVQEKAAVINLNVATAAELERLPGVGPAMAARIVEYRQKNGGFKKIEDLMSVKGIGEKTFLRLKPMITVTPAKAAER